MKSALYFLGALVVLGQGTRAVGQTPTYDPWAPFNFRTVEYMPEDQRLPAAETFVAQRIVPGMPLARAVAILEHADIRCGRPVPGAQVVCTTTNLDHRPWETIRDVTWRVRIQSGPDGGVTSATVSRSIVGGL
jgi:hypothetical protein